MAGAACSPAQQPASANSGVQREHATADIRASADIQASPSEPAAEPTRPQLRRLSAREYYNTLQDLLADSALLAPALSDVEREVGQLPLDGEANASFPEMDARLTARHVSTFVRVAERIAERISESDERLAALAGACALAEPLDAECLARFLKGFGRRVYRRPLHAQELATYREEGSRSANGRTAFRQSLARLFSAPPFLFHLEQDRQLDGYARAARLSYHFWQTAPDAELLAAAESGALLSRDGYQRQVERLLRHQRARATWLRFFREWLELDHFGGFAQDRAFKAFASGVEATSALYSDAVWEVEELAAYYTYTQPGSLRELLTSDRVLTRSRRLAALYGVEPWDGHAPPHGFPRGVRSGLLTRAALLISAQHTTNPFKRGAFVRRRLLCEPLEPPVQRPAEAFVMPAFDAQASTRQRFSRKVSAWSCKGCHELFTPYGYVLETYDALGRQRSAERVIDDAGTELSQVPIDSAARIALEPGTWRTVGDGIALSEALANSAVVASCFARQYFRFSFRRNETAGDRDTLDEMSSALERGGLPALYASVAYTNAFRGANARSVTHEEAPP
jgi:hypothetical protein